MTEQFPVSDLISPMILQAAARSLHDLIAAKDSRAKIAGNFAKSGINSAKWEQKGIYIFPKAMEEQVYEGLFKDFLAAGFLIPPSPGEPLILPEAMSPGEEAKLTKLLAMG
jgi:hypothetical protein